MAQWAKRPPLKLEVPDSDLRGWFRSRWESRPLSLVGNGAAAVTHPIDRAGSVFPRGTGRFLVTKGVHIASFRCLSDETLSSFLTGVEMVRRCHPLCISMLLGRVLDDQIVVESMAWAGFSPVSSWTVS